MPQIPQSTSCSISNSLINNNNNNTNPCNSKSITESSSLTPTSAKNISKPGNVLRLSNTSIPNLRNNNNSNPNQSNEYPGMKQVLKTNDSPQTTGLMHSRNSSVDIVNTNKQSHSRKSSYECSSNIYHYQQQQQQQQHNRNQSIELKQMKTDLGILLTENVAELSNFKDNQYQVNLIVGNHNWISIAYPHFVCCYKLKEGLGWQLMFQSTYIEEEIDRLALNSKHQITSVSNANSGNNINSQNNNVTLNQNVPLNLSNNLNNNNNNNISVNNSSNNQAQQTIEANSKICALLAIAIGNYI